MTQPDSDTERALALLGPLEAKIMALVWSGVLGEGFVVRDVAAHLPHLAYTTLMTTVKRLADKGLLASDAEAKAHRYRRAVDPAGFLAEASRADAASAVQRYGDAALAAFAASLEGLTEEQRARLDRLRRSG